jgi:hypothetical protein
MNRSELERKIKNLGAPRDSYCLNGGFPNEALCLSESSNIWSIYYSEHGQKTEEIFYKNEEEACDGFLFRIQKMLNI